MSVNCKKVIHNAETEKQEKCEEWLLTQEVVEQFIRKGETENGSY